MDYEKLLRSALWAFMSGHCLDDTYDEIRSLVDEGRLTKEEADLLIRNIDRLNHIDISFPERLE